MSILYAKNSGAKICLPIEMNIKLIFILTISLFVKIVSYFVFPAHIRTVLYKIIHFKTWLAVFTIDFSVFSDARINDERHVKYRVHLR